MMEDAGTNILYIFALMIKYVYVQLMNRMHIVILR